MGPGFWQDFRFEANGFFYLTGKKMAVIGG
jgi:hypothetical protein